MKVSVDNKMLRELAYVAKSGGTTDNFISLALDWADQATAYVDKLHDEIKELKEKLNAKQAS